MADTKDTGKEDPKRAVALKYERGQDPAPRLIAKGYGSMAEQLIAIAEKHNIEIRKDAELTEMLSLLDVDSLIPLEAYAAVAEILSYVYKANRNLSSTRMTTKGD